MVEIWKNIEGYDGKYQVSNLGHVKSLNYNGTGKEKVLKPMFDHNYYWQFLYKNKRKYVCKIHRLVAKAFLENPNNLPCINHKDENKLNNRVDNLEWCTIKYNIRYSRARKVGCYKDDELIKVYDSIQSVKTDGFSPSKVCLCCQRKRNHHGGYQWKYIE